jgi:hypothetical protein
MSYIVEVDNVANMQDKRNVERIFLIHNPLQLADKHFGPPVNLALRVGQYRDSELLSKSIHERQEKHGYCCKAKFHSHNFSI